MLFRQKQDPEVKEITIPWTNYKKNDVIISTGTIKIDAPIDVVWECIKNLSSYEKYSGGLYKATLVNKSSSESKAKADETPVVGQSIKLELEEIPSSTLTIFKFDDQNRDIRWGLDLSSICMGVTERCHTLVPSKDGKSTFSVIADKFPRAIGVPTKWFVDVDKIKQCFLALHSGIKMEAERRAKAEPDPIAFKKK